MFLGKNKDVKTIYSLIFLLFLSWRVLLFVPIIVGYFVISFKQDSLYNSIWYYTKAYFPVSLPFVFPFANFDGIHYLRIAAEGYSTNIRFFPLFPILIRIVSLGGNVFGFFNFLAGEIVSNLFFLGSIFLLYRLILLDYKREQAIKTIICLLIFPTSFYFASIYSESLYLFLMVSIFYLSRKDRWILTAVAGFLIGLTRVTGVIAFFVILSELFLKKKKITLSKLTALCSSLLGLLSFSLYNWIYYQNPLYFLKAQGELANGRSTSSIVFPLQTVYRYFKIFMTVSVHEYLFWVAFLEFSVFIFCLVLLFIGFKQKIRLSYLIYLLFGLLIPVSTGTLSGFPRYALVLFPMFLSISLIKDRNFKLAYAVVSLTLLIILTLLFSRGYYIS